MTFSPKRRSAGAQEAQVHLQLGAPVAAGGARGLGADHRATGRPPGDVLDREVLVESGHSGTAVERHQMRECLGSF